MDYSSNITLDDLEKLRILGEGTYGKCYLVQNKVLDQLCVLKQIQIFGMSQIQQKQVMREATILSGLQHPFIVKFLFVFKTDSYLNIVMEYADGGDLNKTIREAKGLYFTQNQILNWFTQICLAIKHIHDRKIIHRDLKCQNIFMTKKGTVKLGDFGIARNLSKTLEKVKTIVGTPYYMSPQICQNKDYSIKTDIWSLGVILYEMCALKLPFEGGSLPALALKISKGEYPPLGANYSSQLKNLVKSLLQNSPNKRPSISKILEQPLIAKRVAQFMSAKSPLLREISCIEINARLKQKQNDQQNLQESLKGNKSDINIQQKYEPISARGNIKSTKTPQAKYSQITNRIKDFASANTKGAKLQKEKRKKTQALRRREISEPNLGAKKYLKNEANDITQVRQQKQEDIDFQNQQESLVDTLRNIVKEKHGEKSDIKYFQTIDSLGLSGDSFSGNGIVSLLWGLQNLVEKN